MTEPTYPHADGDVTVLPPPADRAAVLNEAADFFRGLHATGTTITVQEAEQELRRMAAESTPADTGHGPCPDPIECSHEAALGEARETNRRLNYRAQHLESELAAYRRAVRQWDISERGTYISLASLRAIGLASGKDILGSVRHLKHFARVEQAEAAIDRVRQLHERLAEETDLTSPDDEIARGKAAKLIATALDGWNPTNSPQCDVEFEGGARCAKPAGHRPPGSDDPHVPEQLAAAQQPICKCPTETCRCGHHAAQQPKEARPPTGYGDGKGRVFCLPCAPSVGADVPLTINDVDHWDLCPSCGRHVIDVARSSEESTP